MPTTRIEMNKKDIIDCIKQWARSEYGNEAVDIELSNEEGYTGMGQYETKTYTPKATFKLGARISTDYKD